MPRTKNPPFSEDDKIKVLLWCGRHCCLCAKFSGIGIELHHIEPGSSDIDNAMPVCFDCRAAIGHYNRQAPRGRKYDPRELKERRNQVYEEHTSLSITGSLKRVGRFARLALGSTILVKSTQSVHGFGLLSDRVTGFLGIRARTAITMVGGFGT